MNQTLTQSKNDPASHLLAVIGWAALVIGIFLIVALSMGWLAKVVHLSGLPAEASTPGASTPGASLAPGQSTSFPTPEFRLPSLGGPAISPADYRGQVVVVEFWATWCGPCRLQAKILEDLKAEVGDGVQFLAVDIGESEATVRKYVAKRPFSYPVLLDTSDSLSAPYQIYGLPTVMVVDAAGQVVFHQTGVTDLPTLRKQVEAAKAEA